MTLKFQETLLGNKLTGRATTVPFSSNVTIKHHSSSVCLHSHVQLIPLRHKDKRVSSNGQQVNGYAHCDNNSVWIIEQVDSKTYPRKYADLTEKEVKRDLRYVRSGDYFRLRHASTDSYLKTHDVASPLITTNMEVTTIKPSDPKMEAKFDDTIFEIVMQDKDAKKGEPVSSRKESFMIYSVKYKVAIHSAKKNLLPDWGFKMQQVDGSKKVASKDANNYWTFHTIVHERFVDGNLN